MSTLQKKVKEVDKTLIERLYNKVPISYLCVVCNRYNRHKIHGKPYKGNSLNMYLSKKKLLNASMPIKLCYYLPYELLNKVNGFITTRSPFLCEITHVFLVVFDLRISHIGNKATYQRFKSSFLHWRKTPQKLLSVKLLVL